ncbi:VOC family protein [Cognatishimia sp. SS12]|uniref:VOC family protein n=1 Tax=Cognatishimia sp. SS12 TaxID=2979465 RepID=UPI00232B07DD|nr:VOC family protein [Cognatishimia sp. SS12]MDC0738720.1 VOC family protein [Cognatishimia sp. SS12]
MSFTPYLFFDGNCSEAIDFYADVFGADNVLKMPFSDAPPDIGLPPLADRYMHAQINVGDTVLMCSDVADTSQFEPQAGCAVAHEADTVEAAQATFEKLAEGGKVTMPFEATFFSAGFGVCFDRFGTHWMIMVKDAPSSR